MRPDAYKYPQKPKEPATWRDGTQQVPVDQKAPKPLRDPETGAYREG